MEFIAILKKCSDQFLILITDKKQKILECSEQFINMLAN